MAYIPFLTSIVVSVAVRVVGTLGSINRSFGSCIRSIAYFVVYSSGACSSRILAIVWCGTWRSIGTVILVRIAMSLVARVVIKS